MDKLEFRDCQCTRSWGHFTAACSCSVFLGGRTKLFREVYDGRIKDIAHMLGEGGGWSKVCLSCTTIQQLQQWSRLPNDVGNFSEISKSLMVKILSNLVLLPALSRNLDQRPPKVPSNLNYPIIPWLCSSHKTFVTASAEENLNFFHILKNF